MSQFLLRLGPAAWIDACPSTQEIGRRWAIEGAPEGTAVVARAQTAGRGREGRAWHSAPGLGLWLSFVLRPAFDPADWPALTALAALAAAEAGEELMGTSSWHAAIKWPNDVYGRRGKIAGILAETAGGGLVVGLGLNLAHDPEDFPPHLRRSASSLRLEGMDPAPTPEEAARAFNRCLTWAYGRFQNGDRSFLRDGLCERFFLRGARVRVGSRGSEETDAPSILAEGEAVDVGAAGELVLEAAGLRRSVSSGEVVSWDFPPRAGGESTVPGSTEGER